MTPAAARCGWVALAGAVLVSACGASSQNAAQVNGDAARGRVLLAQYGCGRCHRIPGVASANGNVGPPLDGVGRRVYLAGVLPNSPEHMVRWIRSPQSFKPKTPMPDLNVTEEHATDMVAHLFRLR